MTPPVVYESSFASAFSLLGIGVGRVRAHAHPVPLDLDVRLDPQHLGRVSLDLLDVVGLDMDEAERRPVRRREALLELVDRRGELQLERLESPAGVRSAGALVRSDDADFDHLRAGLAHLRDEAPRQLGGDAASTRGRPDEETAQLGDACSGHTAEGDPDRLAVPCLGDPGRARLRQVVDLLELLVGVRVAPRARLRSPSRTRARARGGRRGRQSSLGGSRSQELCE